MLFAIKKKDEELYVKDKSLALTDNLDDAMTFNSFDLSSTFVKNELNIRDYSILRIVDRGYDYDN